MKQMRYDLVTVMVMRLFTQCDIVGVFQDYEQLTEDERTRFTEACVSIGAKSHKAILEAVGLLQLDRDIAALHAKQDKTQAIA